MKRHSLPILLAALAVALPAVSMADPGDRDDHDRDHRVEARHDHDRPDWDHPGYRHDDYRGAGPDHAWHRGDRLPADYRARRYVVSDWHAHHLSAPPRGYHWVQVNGDYVLAAVATGIILDTLLTQ
jgi:Ni/Co efflux regulator RcnB